MITDFITWLEDYDYENDDPAERNFAKKTYKPRNIGLSMRDRFYNTDLDAEKSGIEFAPRQEYKISKDKHFSKYFTYYKALFINKYGVEPYSAKGRDIINKHGSLKKAVEAQTNLPFQA